MIQKKAKLLYHSCERPNHEELPLNRICIDSNCPSNMLVCSDCIRVDHPNHQVTSLGDFIDRLENIKYADKQPKEDSPMEVAKGLKELRSQTATIIDSTRKQLLNQLERLSVIETSYSRLEDNIKEAGGKSSHSFYYDPSSQLAEINREVKQAVKHYHNEGQSSYGLRNAIEHYRENTNLLKGLLDGLVRDTKDVVGQLCDIFQNSSTMEPSSQKLFSSGTTPVSSKSIIQWSQTLKHPDMNVKGNLVTRTQDTTDNYWTLCLADLGNLTSWRIRIANKCSVDMAIGIMNESQARRMEFWKGSQRGKEAVELMLLDSLGSGGGCLRDAKSGDKFGFQTGDTINFSLDLSKRELSCWKNKNLFTWRVDEVKPPDRYLACVFALQGDSVEILPT